MHRPRRMLDFLRGKASDRKVRLFACACCRRVWHLLVKGSRLAVETAERYADGQCSGDEMKLGVRPSNEVLGKAAIPYTIPVGQSH